MARFFHPDVLKEQARAMTEDDQNMNTRARKILENWITDTATVDKVTQKIVMSAHRHTYGEIMDNIRYFQFKGCTAVNYQILDISTETLKLKHFTRKFVHCFRYRAIPWKNETVPMESQAK